MDKTKYRDVLGNLCYTVKKGLSVYEVVKPRGNDPVYIVEHSMWSRSNARYADFGDEVPLFDSFIKAVRWLKENLDELF